MFKKITTFITLLLGLATPYIVFAQKKVGDALGELNKTAGRTGIEKTDVFSIAAAVIKVALSITGSAFFILMIYSGFKWMTARGDETAVTKSRDTIFAAIIGLSIVVAAYAITRIFTPLL